MKTRCPLPIDWLDFVETGQPDSLAVHLDDCASCRAYVNSLREQASADDLGDWLSKVELTDAVGWQPRPASTIAFAMLVMNASDYDSDDVSYRDVWRLPFVVLDDGRQLGGHRWFKVAPVDTDVENASSTDLLLGADESEVGVPLRVVFSLQTSLAEDQLSDELGRLTAAGPETLRQAIAGELDELRYGLPLSGPDDDRLVADRELDEVVRVLRSPFFALAPEAQEEQAPERADADESDTGDPAEARIFSLNLDKLHARGEQLALAAQSDVTHSALRVWLQTDAGEIEGQLRYELRPRDALLFLIERLEGFASSMQIVIHTKSGEIESPWFVPEPGEEVEVASVFLRDVEEVAVRVR